MKSFWMYIFFCIFALSFSTELFSQKQQSGSKKDSIDITEFYDSAHHWYDINDEVKKVITPLPDQKQFAVTEISNIADNILLYQRANGGFPKNYDMRAILTDEQKNILLAEKNDNSVTTFDNGATHSQIEYLAQAFHKTKNERYKDAALRGIDYIFSAQYANGGFPQFFPDTSGYRKYITFNDGAMLGVLKILRNIVEKKPHYNFVDNARREKAKIAYEKGLACIVRCQIVENGKRTTWCQQHDNIDFRPQKARMFEPAAACGMESAEIALFLMKTKNPSQEIIQSIQSVVRWFNESKILGIRVETIDAPFADYKFHKTTKDKIVVADSTAPPIWTRYYELGTNRPMFCNRDGKPVFSLAEVERERRTGYAWYTYAPQEVLDKYPNWQKKYAPNDNVLK